MNKIKPLKKDTQALIDSFTPRERAVFDYILKGFAQAADDLDHIKPDAHNYHDRLTRIDDRISNYAFTAQVMNIELNYDRHKNYEVSVDIFDRKRR